MSLDLDETEVKALKLVVVGDGYIGKTCMLWSYVYKKFPSGYLPTVFDIHSMRVDHNGEAYTLNLYDTAGQEDWDTLRIMAYPETDVILLCFSVVRPDSMDNVVTKWLPELNKFIPGVIIVLVGTQCDLRDASKTTGGGGVGEQTAGGAACTTNAHQHNHNGGTTAAAAENDPKQRHISTREGEELRQRIKAYKYIECSAITQCNINDVFNTCVEAYARVTAHNSNRTHASCFHSLLTQLASSIRRRFSFRQQQQRRGSSGSNSGSGGGGGGAIASGSKSTSSSKQSSKKQQRVHES